MEGSWCCCGAAVVSTAGCVNARQRPRACRLPPHLRAHIKMEPLQRVIQLRHERKSVVRSRAALLNGDQRPEQRALVAHLAPLAPSPPLMAQTEVQHEPTCSSQTNDLRGREAV